MKTNETNEILKEILKWQKVQGVETLKKRIQEDALFLEKEDTLVYYHTDGSKSSREIEKITGVSRGKVQSLWKKWINVGIAEQTEKYSGGRCKRIFELKELGLENPNPRQ